MVCVPLFIYIYIYITGLVSVYLNVWFLRRHKSFPAFVIVRLRIVSRFIYINLHVQRMLRNKKSLPDDVLQPTITVAQPLFAWCRKRSTYLVSEIGKGNTHTQEKEENSMYLPDYLDHTFTVVNMQMLMSLFVFAYTCVFDSVLF